MNQSLENPAHSDMTNWQYACRYLPFSENAQKEFVYDRLLKSLAHLWIGMGAAGVTEVTDDQNLHIWLCGGDARELVNMLPDVESFGRAMDCGSLEVTGRKGWQRFLKKYGFRQVGDEMVKVL